MAQGTIIKNGVSVQPRLADGLSRIYADRVQLQQMVMNLILNAVEAMGSVKVGPRELWISTEQDHKGVRVAVRDSGPGIDSENRERVFESFYTTKSNGIGMDADLPVDHQWPWGPAMGRAEYTSRSCVSVYHSER